MLHLVAAVPLITPPVPGRAEPQVDALPGEDIAMAMVIAPLCAGGSVAPGLANAVGYMV